MKRFFTITIAIGFGLMSFTKHTPFAAADELVFNFGWVEQDSTFITGFYDVVYRFRNDSLQQNGVYHLLHVIHANHPVSVNQSAAAFDETQKDKKHFFEKHAVWCNTNKWKYIETEKSFLIRAAYGDEFKIKCNARKSNYVQSAQHVLLKYFPFELVQYNKVSATINVHGQKNKGKIEAYALKIKNARAFLYDTNKKIMLVFKCNSKQYLLAAYIDSQGEILTESITFYRLNSPNQWENVIVKNARQTNVFTSKSWQLQIQTNEFELTASHFNINQNIRLYKHSYLLGYVPLVIQQNKARIRLNAAIIAG